MLGDLARELEQAKVNFHGKNLFQLIVDCLQIRCGSTNFSRPPSASIIASPIKVVLPFDGKQELVHLNNTKVSLDRFQSYLSEEIFSLT